MALVAAIPRSSRPGRVLAELVLLAAVTYAAIAVGGLLEPARWTLFWSVPLALITLPVVLLTRRGQPIRRVLIVVFLPAAAAGIAVRIAADTPMAILVPPPLIAALCLVATVTARGPAAALDPSRCGGCGYDLTANETGICPECGAAPTTIPRPRRRWCFTVTSLLLWLAGAAIGVGGFAALLWWIGQQPI